MVSYVYSNGVLILKEDYYTEKYLKTAHLQMMNGNKPVSFYYNSDSMEPTRHMASGKMISSKKKFRDETRAYNCVEVGNEIKIKSRQPVKLDKRQRREDIKKAISDLRNGRKV